MSSKVRMAHELGKKWRSKDVQLLEKAEFSVMLLSERVLTGLAKTGFKTPSPIQLEAIPMGRFGKDLLVQAKSGTGKTLVFTIIALELLKTRLFRPQVLILAPTREIAAQICSVVQAVGSSFRKLTCCSFIGGLPLADDKEHALGCQIVVGTPGRIRQLIKLGSLPTNSIRMLVFDEADQLLQGTFKMEIDDIFKSLPNDKQVIATSATYPARLKKILFQYLKDPYVACLNSNELALLGIVHYTKVINSSLMPLIEYKNKLTALEQILTKLKFCQCLVFCNMISRVEVLCRDIKEWGFSTSYISSAKEQCDRLKAINRLKHFKCKVLVSSDVSSRGIDAENVDLVINFDLAITTETYLHRVGRAGRYGAVGLAVSIITEKQLLYLKKMESEAAFKSYKLPEPLPKDLIRNPSFGEYTIEDDAEEDAAVCENINVYKFEGKVSRKKASKKNSRDVATAKHQCENGTVKATVECQSENNAEDVSVEHQHENNIEETSLEYLKTSEVISELQNVQSNFEATAVEYDSETAKSCDSFSIASTKESDSFDFTHSIEFAGSIKFNQSSFNASSMAENIIETTNNVTEAHLYEEFKHILSEISNEGSSFEYASLFPPCETIISATNLVNEEHLDSDKDGKNKFCNTSVNENICMETVNNKHSSSLESMINSSTAKDEGDVEKCELNDTFTNLQKGFQDINSEMKDDCSKSLNREKKDEYSANLNGDKTNECSENLSTEMKDDCSKGLNLLKSDIVNYIQKYENASEMERENRLSALEASLQKCSYSDGVISGDMIKSLQFKKSDYIYHVLKNYQDDVGESNTLDEDKINTMKEQVKGSDKFVESETQNAVGEKSCDIKDVSKSSAEALCELAEISNAPDLRNLKESGSPNTESANETIHLEVLKPGIKNMSDLSDLSDIKLGDILSIDKPKLHSTPGPRNFDDSIFHFVSSSEDSDSDSASVLHHESVSSLGSSSSYSESDSSSDTSCTEKSGLKRNTKIVTKAAEVLKRRPSSSFPTRSGQKSNHLLQSRSAETSHPKQSFCYPRREGFPNQHKQDPINAHTEYATQYCATNQHRSHFAHNNYNVPSEHKGCFKSLHHNTYVRPSHQQYSNCCPKKTKGAYEQRKDHPTYAGCTSHNIPRNQCAKNTASCCSCHCQSSTACSRGFQSSATCSSMTSPREIFYNQWNYLQRCMNTRF